MKETTLLKQLKVQVDLKITLLNHQNNYVENLNMTSNAKSFHILTTSLSVQNYF